MRRIVITFIVGESPNNSKQGTNGNMKTVVFTFNTAICTITDGHNLNRGDEAACLYQEVEKIKKAQGVLGVKVINLYQIEIQYLPDVVSESRLKSVVLSTCRASFHRRALRGRNGTTTLFGGLRRASSLSIS